jgi:hypothetical protein
MLRRHQNQHLVIAQAASRRDEPCHAAQSMWLDLDLDVVETAHSLLPVSAVRRPPAVEACFFSCCSCDILFPSKSLHPLNFLLRFLPRSLLPGGAAGFSVDGIAAKPQSTERQNSNVAGSMS